ncbi:type IV pilus modification protein PilV [Halomonas sp. PAMB 3264]|uniref:type IV pilus modification protein PilV n=1 Tax=Halomonas sp. PAMB 3264 TaxID=3075222 RepID=UPI0028A14B16|nr:type IV pilus modification protein PilV [Halomonas sp. PAMB 3264]WNL42613.1 type IV pilus modification protein PilV [Halomonas sp. PAMB 3264]
MRRTQQGISLIESLVAMLIMSVGLLGVVALQTNALTQQRSAYLETQATNMAQDMMDRIRANPDEASAYNLDFDEDVGEDCSGPGLVANDTATWICDLEAVLPEGEGKIEVNGQVSVAVRFNNPFSSGKRTIELVTEL